jgi:hypothetical protein
MLLYDTIRCNDYRIAFSCFYLIQRSVVVIISIIRLYICVCLLLCACVCVCVCSAWSEGGCVCVAVCVCCCVRVCCIVLLTTKSYHDLT